MYVLDLRRVRAPPPLPEDVFEFDALAVFAVFDALDALGALTVFAVFNAFAVLGALGALGATALERLFLRLVLRWRSL